ncbi:2,3-dihydro-2,3-dihydroxybenzoate dehydrogenase [Salipaludibacillus agaradhaerens]|uniref:2,3-dihydro-2,3-dihydroxybenzoate dehydrogenase n=1 Tax=Salipaludibacillus agaradhaerens TaxID=76935 RepID=UPI002150C734|nr:2,3-dihydro-2,3-dihydroxybenzoate dehydrogenase [Salipaludibacillus agaradhaerens]MCR6105078.1 2,3-dihydro-2,3-dihydroxybenzoate dehydrogenase [Salipaludibacillus agaradhaerens]MCR6117123.1 2,3-dihydro-2,3-dihydroxybenzoate dehydrogenase [Salipaludibacillus agaradhaerens]
MTYEELAGKVAVVTGGAQGIGAAIVRALVNQGATVAAVDCNETFVEKPPQSLAENEETVHRFKCDVTEKESVDHLIQKIETTVGPIDILVNVAGILKTGAIHELSTEDWHATFAVNTTALFYISQAISRFMITRQDGVIVTVGSNAAYIPRMNMSAYAASKAAATMFSKCLGLELAQHNIRCNSVSPGSTDTPMQRNMWKDDNGGQRVINGNEQEYRTGIPLKRIAEPTDIADAVLFLVSEKSRHITMHDIRIDGGATLGV